MMGVKRSPGLAYQWIEETVKKAQRDLRRPVYPWEVQARMVFFRAEGSLRRDMMSMSKGGRLVRVGGQGARQGYRLPTLTERVSWQLNAGRWPVGSETVLAVR